MSVRLAWEADGRVNAPVAVLLHGLGGSRRSWGPLAGMLLAGYRLALVDLPGCGESRALPQPLTVEAVAEALLPILDQLGARTATAIGHAFGGLVATALAELAPERVERVVAINTPVTIGSRLRSHNAAQRLLLSRAVGQVAWQARTDAVLRVALADSFTPDFSPPGAVVDDLRHCSRIAFIESSKAADSYLRDRPLPARFAALPMATALIFGMLDRRVDSNALPRLHAASPGTEIIELPNTGHSPQWETPQAVADAILQQPVRND